MAELIGQTLGQYEIVGLLGEGGMASVYRARQVSIEREVALKILHATLTDSSSFADRFAHEAKLVGSLSHPHILKVFDYGRDQHVAYLVTELLTGGSLSDLIHLSPLPLEQIERLLDQIASALDYAHHRGVIHRDLKPQNVLLDSEGNAFLTDFGIAKMLNSETGLTQAGAVVGTPAYMSPETWRTETLDARSDVYSLGVILYEMLVGMVPFAATTPFGMMHKHIYETPPSVRNTRPELPAAVDSVVFKALAKEPDDRFSTAGELTKAFRDSVNGVAVPVTRRHVAVWQGGRRPLFIGGAFAGIVIIAGLAFSAISGTSAASISATRTASAVQNATLDARHTATMQMLLSSPTSRANHTPTVTPSRTATAIVTPTETDTPEAQLIPPHK